ncbi:HAD family hydrolase [Ruegeria sp. AU67]|uniref:HAD-IIIC family phosphatase n=1 Tax=Ruegeria sp. AU67 TaxID=2108530 RepID=UPI00135B88B7|nr:HAD-IIIC family phosphatase [Ruegeria sp. AU67]
MTASDAAAALEFYQKAAAESEQPAAQLIVKLARAAMAADDAAMAADWCTRVVDGNAGYSEWASAAAIMQKCPSEVIPAKRRGIRVAIVSTWTTRTFGPLLKLAAARCGMQIEIWEAEYGQYFNETIEPGSGLFQQEPDFVILLPDERALGLAEKTNTEFQPIDEELARWTNVWESIRAHSHASIVQVGFTLRLGSPLGNFAAGFGGSRLTQAVHLNSALANAANAADVAFVDADQLAARNGKAEWFDERSWYLAKIPYAPTALCQLAHQTAVVIGARMGMSRRCLVLDLDNLLWGGVIGDDGLTGIQLGEGAKGEAFVDFQREIKNLANSGIVLAVCSKNDIDVAREPFERHPEMVLSLKDIALFVANWQPKSENIRKISESLDLGLESLTFFDDNPYEREEVRRHVPQVDVPIFPDDPTLYRSVLEAYPYFEQGSFTDAEAQRGMQYRARAQAKELKASSGSLEDYQRSLEMVAQIGAVDDLNMRRVVQLINKTNQFNVTTRRRNRAGVESFVEKPSNWHFWVRLKDRFTDHGLVALALGSVVDEMLEIDTFLMSCRVIGRGLEDVIAYEIAQIAARRGVQHIRGIYIPTDRNGMVADLYPRLGFTAARALEEGLFDATPSSFTSIQPITVEYADQKKAT